MRREEEGEIFFELVVIFYWIMVKFEGEREREEEKRWRKESGENLGWEGVFG